MKLTIPLKTKKIIALLIMAAAFSWLQGCLGFVEKPKGDVKEKMPLKLTADSGYLYKRDVLVFLASNDLTDTLNEWWKKWTPMDTIGKYYKTDTGYLLYLQSANMADNSIGVDKLIELGKGGRYVDSRDFNCQWCHIKRTEALQKMGKYFITYTCGHGAGFSSSWLCLFTKLADRDKSKEILEYQNESALEKCITINSTRKLHGDTCDMVYTIDSGMSTESGCETISTEKVMVSYYCVNGMWLASDSTKVKKLNGRY